MDLVSFFRACVRKSPDKTALIFEGKHFTYREIDEWSDSISSFLARRIASGQTIGVAMRRSPEWIATLLGIWKAGGVYVPLDLDNPHKRLMAIAKDCDLSFVICDKLISFCPNHLPTLFVEQMEGSKYPCPRKHIDSDAPAYIIYTSGTTGTPKGVPITHRQTLLMGAIGGRKVFRLKKEERMLQIAGIGFSVSLVEVTTSLFNDGCMVMATEDERHDPQRLATLLGHERVACAFIPPALLAMMPDVSLPNLHTIVVGGEGMSGPVINRWMHGRRLVNAYGFTENAVHVMNGEYHPGTLPNDIGTPVPGVSAFVVDESLNLVPDGIPGELCISGRQLTSGYWKHPELSEGKFTINPFVTEIEKRKGRNLILYRSGDKVVHQPDGHYLYLGRIDNQIKIRGVRIEPGEIERHLNSYPGVLSSVVLPKKHNGKTILVAYLQTKQSIGQEKIATYLQGLLPDYMCPQRVLTLEKFPLTPNGKTDKARLPEPDWSQTDTVTSPPVSRTEKAIAEIWRKMLAVEYISREDDFIALGGDSISVMLMTDKLEKTFGTKMDATEIYRRKKLSVLAEYIDNKLAEKEKTSDSEGIKAYEPPAPLRNLLVDCLSSVEKNDAYKLALFIPWNKDLDVPALQDAWNRVLQEQDAMRIFFKCERNGKYCVHTAPFYRTDIPMKEIHTDNFLSEAAGLYRQSFDPARPPLHRECLYRLSDGTYILALIIHHLITDGWSLRLLTQALKGYYRKEGNGSGQDYSYQKYARWYRQRLEAPATKEKLDFWRSYMADCPELHFTGNHFKDVINGQQGYALTLPMNPQSAHALEHFCREHSATPFVVCLCVYQILLMKYAGQTDFNVGVAFTDRRKSELHDLMGYLTTLLPVRSIQGKDHFDDLVEQMSRNIVLLSANSLPLDMIGNNLGIRNNDGANQLIRFAFGLEDMPTSLDVPDEWTTASSFDMALSIYRRGSDYSYHYQYAANCFDTAFLTAFSESFDVALLYLTANPRKDIKTCPLLPSHKIASIAATFHFGSLAMTRSNVVASFEKVAKTNPDRDASVWNGQRTSYRELESMSGRVATAIHQRLSHADSHGLPIPIGIRLHEKKHLLAGILGILKSGNCYVPLDADLPLERLEFILKDAGIYLILCDTPLTLEDHECLTMEDALAYDDENMPPAHILPEATAYIIYTSGTTGKPKGSPVSHASLALFAENQSRIFNLQAGSRVLQYANIGFDASVLEIFPTLISSSTLVMPTEEERKDIDRFLGLLEHENVNCALIPPALLTLLPYRRLPCLQVLAVGGENTPEEVLVKWADGRVLVNEYGPTENTVVTTCAVFTKGCQPNNIGQSLPGVSCYVVDKDMNLMPNGVPGELCIGGLQLTEGYLHQDMLNKEKFVENPFVLPKDKERGINTRLYHSGDKVVRTVDGSFLYLGRIDSQVKLRGFRIELDEIIRQLEQHPHVLQALAVLKKTANGHSYIAAYIVAKENLPILPEELNLYLRNRLPAYMVPTAWCMVERFPMTLNGKIDKDALPEPLLSVTDIQVPPSNEEEVVLASIAGKLLGMKQVSVTTDLFDLGLTSLQAMELVFDARKQGLFISTADLYRERHIRNILARRKGNYFYWKGHSGSTSKSIMILIGYPSFTPHYDAFVRLFGEEYDIFVFESFIDTLQGEPDCNASELLKYYHRIVMQELDGKDIFLIAGYCLGGEIAMLLAEVLRKDGWPQIKALVIDSFLLRDKQLPLNGGNGNSGGMECRRILSEIIRSLPQPVFGGDMAVCLTLRPYTYETKEGKTQELPGIQQKNREDWKRIYPHAFYCEVDTDHDHIFEERYMAILHEAVKRHWQSKTTQLENDYEA